MSSERSSSPVPTIPAAGNIPYNPLPVVLMMSQNYETPRPRERTPSVYARIYGTLASLERDDSQGRLPSGLVHGTMWPLISYWRDAERSERKNIERQWTAETGLPVPHLAPDPNSPGSPVFSPYREPTPYWDT